MFSRDVAMPSAQAKTLQETGRRFSIKYRGRTIPNREATSSRFWLVRTYRDVEKMTSTEQETTPVTMESQHTVSQSMKLTYCVAIMKDEKYYLYACDTPHRKRTSRPRFRYMYAPGSIERSILAAPKIRVSWRESFKTAKSVQDLTCTRDKIDKSLST